jgi:hypothetical protein
MLISSTACLEIQGAFSYTWPFGLVRLSLPGLVEEMVAEVQGVVVLVRGAVTRGRAGPVRKVRYIHLIGGGGRLTGSIS